MELARRLSFIAGLIVATTASGCGSGGDYIPLAKVEPPKDTGEAKTPKKPPGIMGSPADPVYK